MKINNIGSVSTYTQLNKTNKVNNGSKFNDLLNANIVKNETQTLDVEEIQYFKKAYPTNAYEISNYKSPFAEIKLGQFIDRKV